HREDEGPHRARPRLPAQLVAAARSPHRPEDRVRRAQARRRLLTLIHREEPVMRIYPVVLSGGSGTRLWPLSRETCPKQFLPLLQGRSPFQATLTRLRGIEGLQPPLIVTSQDHRFL